MIEQQDHEVFEDDQYEMDQAPTKQISFDNYLAHPFLSPWLDACRTICEYHQQTVASPLLIIGPTGSGKTHLAHAICHAMQQQGRPDTQLIDNDAFSGKVITAIRNQEFDLLQQHLAEADALIIDDVDRLAGKPDSQRILARAIDLLTAQGKPVVLTTTRAPADMNHISSRLRQLIVSGTTVCIPYPEGKVKETFLERAFAQAHAQTEAGVIDLLAEQLTTMRELQGAVSTLVNNCTTIDATISREMTEKALQQLMHAPLTESKQPAADTTTTASKRGEMPASDDAIPISTPLGTLSLPEWVVGDCQMPSPISTMKQGYITHLIYPRFTMQWKLPDEDGALSVEHILPLDQDSACQIHDNPEIAELWKKLAEKELQLWWQQCHDKEVSA